MRINVSSGRLTDIYGQGFLYVDKTRFLRDWWFEGNTVTLITRPRRFGKSLLLSTVQSFFDPNFKDARKTDGTPLFEGLEVWNDDRMRALHGTVPVISLCTSGLQDVSGAGIRELLAYRVRIQYSNYKGILQSGKLNDVEKEQFLRYQSDGGGDKPEFAVLALCQFLWFVYGVKPIILMDEYDAPLTEAFVKGNLDDVVSALRTFYVAAFKDNDFMSKCLITGITRIAQKSLFSDFNSPEIDTMINSSYPTVLGYTQDDVKKLLEMAGLEDEIEKVRHVYDGYTVGAERHIYNPFSLNHFLKKRQLGRFWIDSSQNTLARDVIRNGSPQIQNVLADLLEGKTITTDLPVNLIYSNLYRQPASAFSMLFSAGFLKLVSKMIISEFPYKESYEVSIPNEEVRSFYSEIFTNV